MVVGDNTHGQLGLSANITNQFEFIENIFLNSLSNLQFANVYLFSDDSFFIQGPPINTKKISNSSINLAAVVIPIVLVALIVVFLGVFFLLRKRTKSSLQFQTAELTDLNITLFKATLIGGSNSVYKGTYTGKDVALKKVLNDKIANEILIFQ